MNTNKQNMAFTASCQRLHSKARGEKQSPNKLDGWKDTATMPALLSLQQSKPLACKLEESQQVNK